ncbi:MAG: hypothetical protein JWO08_4031, partial [Verrucomicrobiaceae bacterium]|nr:hypothetical protein [Verrucomicrobiaceae bacterium]
MTFKTLVLAAVSFAIPLHAQPAQVDAPLSTVASLFSIFHQLCERDPELASKAAVSLGAIAARNDPVMSSQRANTLGALQAAFERFGTGCTRIDADSGWRPVGNAIRAFGEEGEAVLRSLRDQRIDLGLADIAWLSLKEEAAGPRPRADDDLAKNPLVHPPGRSLHVDPFNGDDKNEGIIKPVKTIKRAIRMAEPGDTIHLAPVLYYEYADLTLKHGALGRPITLDGHGAVLDGSEPVMAKDWESTGDGVYRKQHLMRNMDTAVLGRFFLIWSGKANHMGRTSKGTSKPFKKAADLTVGEWTYTPEDDTVYVKIDPKQGLDEAKIRYPLRSAGVAESISCSHLVVRNVIATHVYNDGYNIHGLTRDCRFENIAAIDCGDDGFSAHDDCECDTDGFVSIGNSTGLTDTVDSITRFKNVYMRDNLGHDVFFIGENFHSIENGLIESSAQYALSIGVSGTHNFEGVSCPVELKNVLFRRLGSAQEG